MKHSTQLESVVLCTQDFHIHEENRTVPAWSDYRYHHETEDGEYAVFREYVLREEDARTFFMCPKGGQFLLRSTANWASFFLSLFPLQGFSIAQLSHALLLNRNQTEGGNPFLNRKTIPFVHASTRTPFPTSLGRTVTPPDPLQPEELCSTLRECLLYQACVFSFGNEFCRRDPLQGARKNMNVNVTCVKVKKILFRQPLNLKHDSLGFTSWTTQDSNLEHFLQDEDLGQEEHLRRRDLVGPFTKSINENKKSFEFC